MNRPDRPAWTTLVAALVLCILTVGCGGSAETTASTLVDIGAGLRGLPGLEASVVATGLTHAAVIAEDDQHRLFVGTAAFDDDGTDTVSVIAPEGATPRVVLAAQHTVLGLLWVGDALYVASKGGVVAYRGFDGTTFASSTTVLSLDPGAGMVNGLVQLPDGRLLTDISAPCDHCTPTAARSAAVLAFRPDGSDVTVYASHIRTAVAFARDAATGEVLVTVNHRDDLGEDTPGDWLAVVHEGDSFGFPDCWGQGGAPCHGVPAPVAVLDAHAGLSGVAIVHDELGSGVGHAAIVAEWTFGAVKLVALDATAGQARGAVSTFVEGIANPVAVLGPTAGGIVISDWTSGTIYRIRTR